MISNVCSNFVMLTYSLFKTSESILVNYEKFPVFSYMKDDSDAMPCNTWGHSGMRDVLSFLTAVKYKCLFYLDIVYIYL